MGKKVVIGLSGGIDSSMAALMLKQQGFDVIGLHFSFAEEKYNHQLTQISERLKIPVVQLDIRSDFEIVKKHFADEYLKGRTPSPCTYCNRIIKWKKLIEFADENNCDFISSGHYIRKIERNGFSFLQKAVDPIKDQSYFLWELDSKIIKRMIHPLGELNKNEVRKLAIENGFPDLAQKKESMGVCFLQNMDYRNFLQNYIPKEYSKIKHGIVKDESDQVIGTHEGYINYTIGQKRGLNLHVNRQAYVSCINSEKNELKVGIKDSLNHYHIQVENVHLIDSGSVKVNERISVNIRGLGLNPEEPALVKSYDSDVIELELSNPAWAVAPGQPIVFYDGDVLLGGGIAEKSW